MPPKCQPLESYFPYNYSRNTNLQGDEHGYHNIEDQVPNDPMDEDDIIDVDVFVTSECIYLCILCIVTRCLFRDVSIM